MPVDDRDDLSRRLWLLREQMEQLVCALDIQQLVLTNDRLRWLPMVSENVDHIVDDITAAEAERILVSRRVASSLGLSDDASLSQLIDNVGEPYSSVWRQCRLHLVALQVEANELTHENHELTRRGLNAAADMLRTLSGDLHDTYDPSGGTARLSLSSARFDRTA